MKPSPSFHLRLALVAGALLVAAVGLGQAASADSTYPALVNPTSNIAPSPNIFFSGNCSGGPGAWTCENPCVDASLTWFVGGNSAACAAYSMKAINNARATLGESPLTLPSNWLALTTAQQLFVIADMERVSAGYPPYLGLNDALNAAAQLAANANQDPSPAAGFAEGYNASGQLGYDGVAASTISVLDADFLWMYTDGWGGSAATTSNVACDSATSAGCWGHRDSLLGSFTSPTQGVGLGCTTCEVGSAVTVANGQMELVDLIELPAATPPSMSFTWASELPYFTAPTPPSTTTTTTTTTTTPHAPGVPRATAHKVSFNARGLRLAWRLSSGSSVQVGELSYVGTNCQHPAGSYRASTYGRSRGVITVPFRGHYVARRYYSTRVFVVTTTGTATGACVDLGRA